MFVGPTVIIISIAIFATLLILAIGQTVYVLLFSQAIRQPAEKLLSLEHCPKAAIIVCLRGSDPFLRNCLQGITDQDYPNFEIHLVVDHASDPAWETVNSFSSRHQNIRTATLTSARTTCSLKCSCLVQAIESLDDDIQFVALADADTIPDTNWLRRLATDLGEEHIGAVTGIRWYVPCDTNWGTLVRYVWNAAAIVQMYLYQIAWGGTLAVKTSVIRELNLVDKWGQSFCEDTMLKSLLAKKELEIHTSAELIMTNRESCNLSYFFQFLKRQLVTVRLYHPNWWLVAGHAVALGGTALLALIFGMVALLQLELLPLAWILAGMVVFLGANYILIGKIARAIRSRAANDQRLSFSPTSSLRLALATMMAIPVHSIALLKTLISNKVHWRGIDYKIEDHSKIRLLEYRPFQEKELELTHRSI